MNSLNSEMTPDDKRHALQAIQIHKWIESERAGRDLGPAAFEDWQQRFLIPFIEGRRRQRTGDEPQDPDDA